MKAPKIIERLILFLVSKAGCLIIMCLGATIRWDISSLNKLEPYLNGSIIFAFWHNRLLLMPYICRRFFKGRRVVVLASRSRDGDYIAEVLKCFPLITVVRGSTTRGGASAIRAMSTYITQGYDAAITPDGPRGPKYSVQPGAVALAKLTRRPLIPATYIVSRALRLNTWDDFIIPLPFTKIKVELADPIFVEDYEDVDIVSSRLHRVLAYVSARSDKKYLKK